MPTITLSDHFGYRKLLRFTLPTIAMMIFTSIYSVVDGVFVSNFVGKTPFAAVNLMMPFLFLIGVVGSVLGTGGSALVAKTLGEGDRGKANSIFSMLVVASFVSGVDGLSYLLVGFNFYASSFFTALNNGKVSAIISTVRTLVFETAAVFILPALFGVDGIWFAIVCAEVLSLALSFAMLKKHRGRYHYA